jgi:hypothetical protein
MNHNPTFLKPSSQARMEGARHIIKTVCSTRAHGIILTQICTCRSSRNAFRIPRSNCCKMGPREINDTVPVVLIMPAARRSRTNLHRNRYALGKTAPYQHVGYLKTCSDLYEIAQANSTPLAPPPTTATCKGRSAALARINNASNRDTSLHTWLVQRPVQQCDAEALKALTWPSQLHASPGNRFDGNDMRFSPRNG